MSDARRAPSANVPSIEDWFDGELNEDGNAALPPQESHPAESSDPAKQLLIHSLLLGQFQSPTSREDRIQATLDAFDQQHEPAPSSPTSTRRTLETRNQWLLFATTAATVMLGLGVWGLFGPQSAQAALSRVLEATRLPVTRVYDAKICRRALGREVQRDAVLYSRSINLFAAEFPESKGRRKAWIGYDGDQRWLATENFQWRSTDSGDQWSDALFDRMTSKNMHYNAMLTELPDSFELRLMPRETISIGETSFECQPIEATPRDPARGYPDVIRIWPHPQSGVILQMHVIVNDGRPLSVRRIELQLLREQEAPEEFFTLEFHQPQ
ncbi:MAG: hypothetical protein AB8B91_19030 [Rubripirellula sp.]